MNNNEIKKKHKKNGNKNKFTHEIKYDLGFYEYQKRLDEEYIEQTKSIYHNQPNILDFQNIEHLSNKEKSIFESKFSKPRNVSQKKLLKSLENKDYKIIIASGPAGTGKTLFGIEQGIKNFILGNYDKLIFTRPVVTVDEDIGFLPGTLEDKLGPYVRPIFDILHTFISVGEVKYLLEEKIIEIAPLGMMRGRTFKNSWIVADEMQNCTISQMNMLLTILGENSRLVITGDLEQNDRHGEINGLEDFLNKIKGRRSDSISSVEFDKSDIEREKIVKEVLEIYETNKIPYQYQCENIDDEIS
jgi:phosphate starvation-inducible PhoH-like protein